MSNIPNLSNMADTEWAEMDLLDSMIDGAKLNIPTTTTNNTSQINTQQPVLPPVKDKQDTNLEEFLNNSIEPINNTVNLSTEQPNTQTVTNNENTNINNTDAIDLALTLIKELDLIRIPDELKDTQLNEEGLKALVEETNKQKESEFIDYMRSQIVHDPYMQDMFEYILAGGQFSDLPLMQQMTNELIDYQYFDLTDEYNQQYIVQQYMSEGLNPDSPKDANLLELIPAKINQLTTDMVLRDKAIEAQNYFVNKINSERNAEYQRAEQLRIENDNQVKLQKQKEAQWEKAFVTTLANRKWSEDKKKAIGEETKYVKLTTGETLPMWEYKQRVIFNTPELFQDYLDFMSKFDIKENKFIDTPATEKVKSKNSELQKIVDRINNKSQSTNTNSSTTEPTDKKNKKQNNYFNPNNDLFFK